MGILSTLGSVALDYAKQNVTRKVVKNVVNKTSSPEKAQPSTQGGALLPSMDKSIDTSIFQNEAQQKQEALNKDFRTYEASNLYTQETGSDLFVKPKTVDEMSSDIDKVMGAKSFYDYSASESQNRVNSYKNAIKEFSTPANKIEQTLKTAVGEKKYNKFNEIIDMGQHYVTAARADGSDFKEGMGGTNTFARALYKGIGFDMITDKLTGGQIGAYNKAADYLNAVGDVNENDATLMLGKLIGDLPVYGAASYFGAAATGEGLLALGAAMQSSKALALGSSVAGEGVLAGELVGSSVTAARMGSIGYANYANKIGQAGLKMLNMQKNNGYLYNAIFDSSFSTATEYGMRKINGEDMTKEEVFNSMVIGAIAPPIIEEIGKSSIAIVKKGIDVTQSILKPRDFKTLDSIIKQGKDSGLTSMKDILEANQDVKLESGKTLGELLESVPKSGAIGDFNGIDVSVGLAKNGVSVSTLAAKRIANFVKSANEAIDKAMKLEKDPSQIALSVNEVISTINQSKVHDEKSIMNIIKEVTGKNKTGADIKVESPTISNEDIVSDIIHSPTFDIDKFGKATSIDTIVEAFTGTKKVSIQDIEVARLTVYTMNRGAAKNIKELAESSGVKFDWDKALDKFGVTNKEYLNEVLLQVEATVTGYGKFSTKLKKGVRESYMKMKDNLKAATRFDAIGTGRQGIDDLTTMYREVSLMEKRLRDASTVREKNAIKATIEKKNLQIADIRKRNEGNMGALRTKLNDKIARVKAENAQKNADRKAVYSLIKSEIEGISRKSEFIVLTKKEIKNLKDKYKARIAGKTTLKQAEDIVNGFGEEIYNAAYKKLHKQISSLINEVNKQVSGKTTKSKIDPYFVKLMNDVNSIVTKDSDLNALHSIKMKLDTYKKEGRDVFTENKNNISRNANEDFVRVAMDLENAGKTRIEALGSNTPERGMGSGKSIFTAVQDFFAGNVGKHHALDKMFGANSHGSKIFDVEPRKALSQFILKKNDILNHVFPRLVRSVKNITGDNDSLVNKATMWRLRNSGGNDYNLWNDMVVFKDKKGDYQFGARADMDNLKAGDIKFLDLSIEQRQAILDDWYREFDNEYLNNAGFKSAENDLRAYFQGVGLSVSDKFRRLAGKEFPMNELNHHPAVMMDRFNSSDIIDSNMNYNKFTKDALNDSFSFKRNPPKGPIKLNTDLFSTLSYHINTATYWDSMIEPLLRMEKLHNKLRTGKISNDYEDDIFSKLMKGGVDNDDNAIDVLTDIDRFTLGMEDGGTSSKYLSKEADKFLRTHIGVMATQGANLRGINSQAALEVLTRTHEYVIPSLLGGFKTPFKQLGSLFDVAMVGGEANSRSGMRSLFGGGDGSSGGGLIDLDNIGIAMKTSGYLYDRMPQQLAESSQGRNLMTQGNKSKIASMIDKRNDWLSHVVGYAIRTTDGGVSLNAWFTGMSKYLDEVHPELHTSGKKVNLRDVRSTLSEDEYMDAVAYSDKFMTKIMGSNHIQDQGHESGGALSRLVFFLGRTGLNRTMLLLEHGAKIISPNQKIKAGDRALAASALTLNIAANYTLFKLIDGTYANVTEWMGSKSEEDNNKFFSLLGKEIENPDMQDKLLRELWYTFNTMLVTPSTGASLQDGFTPLVQWGKKVTNAPTLPRMAEEALYTGIRGGVGIHNDFINLGRKVVTEGGKLIDEEFDITNVGNAEYDSAVKDIFKTIEIPGDSYKAPGIGNLIQGKTRGGVDLPTGDKLDSMVKQQKEISKVQSKISADKNLDKATEQGFISGYVSEYPDLSKDGFMKYTQKNKDNLKAMGINSKSQILALYTKAELQSKRSQGSENSLLMGKSADVIFEIKVKPFIDSGDYNGAIEEIKRLSSEGVVKNKAGVTQIVNLSKEYASQRNTR